MSPNASLMSELALSRGDSTKTTSAVSKNEYEMSDVHQRAELDYDSAGEPSLRRRNPPFWDFIMSTAKLRHKQSHLTEPSISVDTSGRGQPQSGRPAHKSRECLLLSILFVLETMAVLW